MTERTPDGRYVVINGRRWRATDPAIPAEAQAQLRSALMGARRAVRKALRDGDSAAERAARARVQVANEALGERGTPWWEQSGAERERRWRAGLSRLA
ncbi:hypothetical protein HPO96_36785 [Kribbella sandramycini]|uniref:Biopolymer transporter Tol n=1 Tax=Kribbella sandramycini TaxID=60450 RepID=A0A7Y4P554_9ACTN|nr:hypothetical protein [Kribbella sandramycini]MBB6570267.1 hypothetical protein [Kribbella sandramycini]NOL45815.1 hypothetical protein [Kribbella sandramycini]